MSVWIQNLKMAMEHREVIILHGNVRDRYIVPQNDIVYENLTEMIRDLWKTKYQRVILYDTVGQERVFEESTSSKKQADQIEQAVPPERIFAKWEKKYLNSPKENTLATIFYLDKLISFKANYSQEEMKLLLHLEKLIDNITSNNRLILVALRDVMVPLELYTNSPKTSVIAIPPPDKEDRKAYLKHQLGEHKSLDLITDLSDGLYLRDLDAIASEIKSKSEIGSKEIKLLINKYRIGEQEDYWGKLDIDKISEGFDWFTGDNGVKGQDEAVKKVIATVTLARAGMSGMSSGTASKPKGVLFFAGPTGVGKTFLAKKLAEFLFGSQEAFIRFDMSEFKEEHALSKFIGSPPGYIGSDRGGLLTNAVKERPFSVVLFDEIEKAHPKIMDMFLQMLDDGRLTDRRGQTVFFTETVIIFTSNIGTRSRDSVGKDIEEKMNIDRIKEEKISPDERKQKVQDHFRKAVEEFFMSEISRPELLNRIGNNIIAFNYIDDKGIQTDIVKSNLKRIKTDFEDRFKQKHYTIVFTDAVIDHIATNNSKKIAEFGGRSVTTSIEDEVMKELSREVLKAEYNETTDTKFSVVVDEKNQIRVKST
jgi:ATP-dependent Clp protease ATP-binding subunit ClpA